MSGAEEVVAEIEKNEGLRKRLAAALASDPETRILILRSIVREVATKQDLRDLENRLNIRINDIYRLIDARISDLNKRIDSLERSFDARLTDLDKRIDSLDKRIEMLERRMDFVARISIILTGSVMAAIVAQLIVLILR